MDEFLWYIPNTVEAGHRGDDVATGWADLDQSARLARIVEDHGWGDAPYLREAARIGDELLPRLRGADGTPTAE
jgi:hypothetical protein